MGAVCFVEKSREFLVEGEFGGGVCGDQAALLGVVAQFFTLELQTILFTCVLGV